MQVNRFLLSGASRESRDRSWPVTMQDYVYMCRFANSAEGNLPFGGIAHAQPEVGVIDCIVRFGSEVMITRAESDAINAPRGLFNNLID